MANKTKTQSSAKQMKLLSSASLTATSRAGNADNASAQTKVATDNLNADKTMRTGVVTRHYTLEDELKTFNETMGYHKFTTDHNGWLIHEGDLDIPYYSSLRHSPGDKMEVRGNLRMAASKVARLPRVLLVRGSLILDDTSIESLPESLFVGDDLSIDRTKVNGRTIRKSEESIHPYRRNDDNLLRVSIEEAIDSGDQLIWEALPCEEHRIGRWLVSQVGEEAIEAMEIWRASNS